LFPFINGNCPCVSRRKKIKKLKKNSSSLTSPPRKWALSGPPITLCQKQALVNFQTRASNSIKLVLFSGSKYQQPEIISSGLL